MHSRVQNEISTQALRLDSYFLIGGDRPVQKEYFENYGIFINREGEVVDQYLKQHPVPFGCLLYTSPSPRDQRGSRMPSSA